MGPGHVSPYIRVIIRAGIKPAPAIEYICCEKTGSGMAHGA